MAGATPALACGVAGNTSVRSFGPGLGPGPAGGHGMDAGRLRPDGRRARIESRMRSPGRLSGKRPRRRQERQTHFTRYGSQPSVRLNWRKPAEAPENMSYMNQAGVPSDRRRSIIVWISSVRSRYMTP